ncbi:MAG: hypothetical protein ACI4OX_06920 [Akkermansia sp.]
MAELFARVLAEPEFSGVFKRVFFSVMEKHESPRGGSFESFSEVFNPTASNLINILQEKEIFVFGSNLAGLHYGGAARVAHERFGAIWVQETGLQGQCYVIPIMHGGIREIAPYVDQFAADAAAHPELRFLVTRIGCGIAGFQDEDIAPLIDRAARLPNVCLSMSFQRVLGSDAFL